MKKIDEFDLDKIITDYTPYIKKVINNMSNNNLSIEDKEEIISDTFFILWKNHENINTSIDSYIAGIARNLVREKFRKRNITYDLSLYENTIEGLYDTQEELEKEADFDELRKVYNNLKDVEIEIINMFYYDSKSTKEIAKELNLSEINVRSKLHRIRKKIKKFIKKEVS